MEELLKEILAELKLINERLEPKVVSIDFSIKKKGAAEAAAAIDNRKCVHCKEVEGELQLDEYGWICTNCAQHMSDLGNEADH